MEFPKPTSRYNHEPTPATDPKRPELSVAGKVVLITGGGTGIGVAMVKAFATAGAKAIVISGRRQNLLEETVKNVSQALSILCISTCPMGCQYASSGGLQYAIELLLSVPNTRALRVAYYTRV